MDAASLSFAILSTFNVVVEDIRLIRVAQSLGPDFETAQLKLAITSYRLVRWGKSVGLTEEDVNSTKSTDLHLRLLVPEERREAARNALVGIRDRVGQAQEKMVRLERSKEEREEKSSWKRRFSQAPPTKNKDPSTEFNVLPLDEQMRTLIGGLDQLSLKHTRAMSLSKKIMWTLFEKDELTSLLSDIRDFVQDLENLFPGSQPTRAALADEEAGVAETKEMMNILKGLAAANDTRDRELSAAVTKAIQAATASAGAGRVVNNQFGTNYGHQTGDDANFHGGTFNFGGSGKNA